MKIQALFIAGMLSLLTIACNQQGTSQQTGTETQPATVATKSAGNASEAGVFQDGEHPTKGKVSVVTENGKRYLEFDGNFKTDNGPDLYVILHKSSTVPISGVKEKDYVSVARLQKVSGTQRYPVPENVKLDDFKSVAIWCRKFNATFGFAPLG
ncbi:MAG: DM13 domain-containing protein [Sphaerospermopsis sp.]|nr:DM13 domain-containing protein [Sphaerospermopsis sp.]